ncbi:DMT family transporter [Candidatus Eisenbacteria bacterium]|uniref:DMT family transporter n=1 Tax=Eiseniibacteriota bacterium TaxID=2212470 RepID=A0ABV6YJQ1_UNCEI
MTPSSQPTVRQTRAYLYAMCAVLLWSTVATAFKVTLRTLTPDELLLYASFVAAVVLFAVLIFQGKLELLRSCSPGDYLRSVLAGFLNPFFYYVILFRAYTLLPGQEAQPLNFTWAIALTLLSIPLLKQRIRPASLLAILISFVGVYVIATRGSLFSLRLSDPLGVFLALSSSIVWALFWILNLKDARDEVVKLFLGFLCGFVFTFVFVVITGSIRVPDGPAIAGAVYVGLFEMGVTFLLWLKALKLSRTTARVSNLIFLSPFVSLLLLSWIADETISTSSVAGLAFIVAGIVLQKRLG